MYSALPMLSILTTTVFWGMSYVATKHLLSTLSPEQVAPLRFIVASVVLGLIGVTTRSVKKVDPKDWPRLVAAGLIGIPVYFAFENYGLSLTTASSASLIIATIPVINLLMARLLLREPVTFAKGLGVVMSFLGVYWVIRTGPADGAAGSHLVGDLLVLGAAFSWVAYTHLNRPLLDRYDTVSLNILQTWVGTAALIPIGAREGISLPSLTIPVALSLLYLAVCCSAAAYMLYLYSLRHLGSVTVTCFINLIPIFGVLGGVLFLDERVAPAQLAGGLLLLAGVSMATIAPHRESRKTCASPSIA